MKGMFARKRFQHQQQLCESAALEELKKRVGSRYSVLNIRTRGNFCLNIKSEFNNFLLPLSLSLSLSELIDITVREIPRSRYSHATT